MAGMLARLFGRQRREIDGPTPAELIPLRTGRRRGSVAVTNDTALRHSAVWACLRLRANLISTLPCDVYRKVGRIRVEMPKPPVLREPGGARWDYIDWMHATQIDLDRTGNTIGLITATNALGLPSQIELAPINSCSVIERRGTGELIYRIDGKDYTPDKIWHERQYPVAGSVVGLSPVAYAAWSIGEYLSILDFALDWFGGGAVPKGRLKNTAMTISNADAIAVKDRYNASISNGDIFVHGMDWEYDMIQAANAGMEWIEARRYGLGDIARFFDCPADLIDAGVSSGGAITYANITQRNLQFLIMSLDPAIRRRENKLSKLLPEPRYVKLNGDSLLRMDPQTRAAVIEQRLKSKTLTNTEARELYDLPPLSSDEMDEFDKLYGPPKTSIKPVKASPAQFELGLAAPIRAIATVGEPVEWEAS